MKVQAEANIVLREESDQWSLLFNPDTGESYVIDPVATLIWKSLDGKNSLEDIINKIKQNCEDVPPDVNEHCQSFIQDVLSKNLAKDLK